MNTPKIAVIMVGHIKNSIKMGNHTRIIDNLLEKNDCDLFIYTNKYYSFRNKIRNNPPETNIQEFYDLYKKYIKKIIIEDYEPSICKIMHKIGKNQGSILKKLREKNKNYDYPRSPIVNKTAFINDIKNIYAKENNINYDYILIIRPDNEIDKVINFNDIHLKKNQVMYSEWYILGRPYSIDIYCNKNKLFLKKRYNPFTFKKCHGETYFLKKCKIDIVNKKTRLLGMKLPENSNAFYPEHIPYDESISNDKRVFIVKDYSKENIESEFYKNYKQVDENFIEYIKDKYQELL